MPGNDDYTVCLLHMNGDDESTTFTDDAHNGTHTWTASADAQVDTAQKKFGTASGLFDGTGDFIDTADSADWDVGSGDFTIDVWFKRNATGAVHYISGQIDSSGTSTTASHILQINGFNKLYGAIFDNTIHGTHAIIGGTNILDTNWHHAAFVRDGNNLRLFLDGVSDAVAVDVTGITAFNSTNKMAVGRWGEYTGGGNFNGWLDEFRFSKGVARWTSNFTPSTEEYDNLVIYSYTATGGIDFAGAATLSKEKVFLTSGGMDFAGAATTQKSTCVGLYVASGGFDFGGAAALLKEKVYVATGGLDVGGAAAVLKIKVFLASGGITFAGAATLVKEKAFVATGGVDFAGAATLLKIKIYTPSGGVDFGGAAVTDLDESINEYVASGGITFGGTATTSTAVAVWFDRSVETSNTWAAQAAVATNTWADQAATASNSWSDI